MAFRAEANRLAVILENDLHGSLSLAGKLWESLSAPVVERSVRQSLRLALLRRRRRGYSSGFCRMMTLLPTGTRS